MSNGTIALLGLTFFAAFAITALLVPPVMRLCERRGWLAHPGGRRLHARPTPNVGGMAIYGGFVLTLLGTFAFDPFLPRSDFEKLRLALLLAGATLIFLVMWLDDVRELPPLPKFIAQSLAALIAVGPFLWDHTLYPPGDQARGIILTAFKFPFVEQVNLYNVSPWLAIVATVFWVGWMTNTINFVDGIDGLAAGVSLIAALALAFNALRQDPPQATIALLPLALAGTCAGFLLFNFPPARLFMGDSGAEFLGYVLGVSAIIGGAKLATVLLVLGVPILDVAWLIVSRALSGRSPAQGGRDHLHLRLIDLGFSTRQIVIFYYAISASFGVLGISGAEPRFKLMALALLALIVAGVIVYLSRRSAATAR
ncbi:MAG TPA: MraY family glycosyltransferase [Roseiflexaceae bacterium]|nr:MraY family glycosyltransferase [Roseiflexaceae bacterium]